MEQDSNFDNLLPRLKLIRILSTEENGNTSSLKIEYYKYDH